MIGRQFTAALVAIGCLATGATRVEACKLFGCGRPTTTFYTPYVASYAPVAPVCAPQQVVNYMPQTAYRAVTVNRPVVSYMPQTACDACGRATTVMRPVTTYVSQQQLVPYTTYRPVVTSVARPCCATVPTVVSYAPAVPVAAPACCGATPAPTLSSYSPAPVAAPAPACCGSTPTPSLSGYSSTTGTTIVQPSTSSPSGSPGSTLQSLTPTPDPSLNGSSYPSSSPSNSTFAPNGGNGSTNGSGSTGSGTQPQSRVLLPPYNNGTSSPTSSSLNEQPRGLDPEDGDRTTSISVRSGWPVRQASLVLPAKADVRPVDNGGWEAVAD